ncbi:Chemotaxis protein CheA [Candidatus Bealeia paramacronuclearis]|uniref:histidine kinase n=2 Tax=Candidatus Bealeia paramacronuclearis TaxID=1921001 RepID=A0ABZ2C3I7_9PROT|nr:Chemotaxis protein CheA [Candidatus Bealeia paramacronuclearis]
MDVVKTNIEKIGGNIEVKSVTGKGATFTITIPLTLAIVAALIVGVEDQRYAIPQVSILELVRIASDSEHTIEYINNNPVLRLRNRLLQLVFLNELFGIEKTKETEHSNINEDQYVLIVQVGSYYFGIVVSEVFDTQEIVVKPVSPLLQGINVYAGNTILGDGSVVMILDPKGVILRKGEIDLTDRGAEDLNDRKTFAEDLTSLLLFKAGDEAPKAVPLELVVRLEEFDVKDIEHSHHQSIIQYREQLMPLIPFDQYGGIPQEGTVAVLVFSNGEHFAGLIVDQIIDIVEERVELKMQSTTDDVYGTAVISGHATDVIDADHYIRHLFPKWGGAENRKVSASKKSVLLLGDGVFFRNILGTLLRMEGYQTQRADSLAKALRIIEQGHIFDAVIQDFDSTTSFDSDDTGSLKRFLECHPLLLLTEDGNLPQGGRLYGEGLCCGKEDRGMILRAISELIEQTQREAA